MIYTYSDFYLTWDYNIIIWNTVLYKSNIIHIISYISRISILSPNFKHFISQKANKHIVI